MSAGLSLFIGFLLVLLNGFFVATEFALVRVRSTRLTELANEGKASARMALHAIRHFDVYLSATQLGITLASLALGATAEPAVGELMRPVYDQFHVAEGARHALSFLVMLMTISVFHMVIGELVPKSMAIQRTEGLALSVAYPLHWFYVLFKPVIFVINRLSRIVLRLLRLQPIPETEMSHSEEELRMILTASGESGVLKDSEVDLVKHVFEFGDKVARDVMVPRVDMVYLDVTWPIARNLEVAHAHTFTRFPLCEGEPDHVIGMVHVKEIIRIGGGDGDLRAAKREILFVPENKGIDQLLRQFQISRVHMAVVVDEYGGTAGIVTLEDVIEQIVGEIYDEDEEPQPEVLPQGPDRFLVDGGVLLADLKADYEIDLPPNDSDTIAGWMLDRVGSIPEPGETVETEGYSLQVQEMAGQRLRKVLIVRHPEPAQTEPAEV